MTNNKTFRKKAARAIVAIRRLDAALGKTPYSSTAISQLQQLAGFRVTGR